MPEHLTEHVADWRVAVEVDRIARRIKNVALAGAASKNGYRYQEAALKSAAALYEGVPVFLDHPTSSLRPRDRSARDLAGGVSNVRYEAGRLRGDIATLDTEAGRTLLALAEADGPGVGMSHVVLAERSRDGRTVERIVEVVSVDAVAFPATTATFRESAGGVSQGAPTSVPLSLGRGVRGEGSSSTSLPSCAACRTGGGSAVRETASGEAGVRGTRDAEDVPSPPAPLPRERGDERGEPQDYRDSASRLSLEGLLSRIDAELPGRLRRLAAAPRGPGRGRGVRAGVYPGFVLVEWRAVNRPPERYALAWRFEDDAVAFGDELLPEAAVAERLADWSAPFSSFTETHERTENPHRNQVETLAERLSEAAAERDALSAERDGLAAEVARLTDVRAVERLLERSSLPTDAVTPAFRQQLAAAAPEVRAALIEDRRRLVERLAAREPTSVPRRGATATRDELFVRAIRRR